MLIKKKNLSKTNIFCKNLLQSEIRIENLFYFEKYNQNKNSSKSICDKLFIEVSILSFLKKKSTISGT